MRTSSSPLVEAPPRSVDGSIAAERRRVLVPFVEALEAWHSVQARAVDPDATLTLMLGGQPFEIGVWERAQLRALFEPSVTPDPRGQLFGLSIALITKCALDLEHFDPMERSIGWYEKQAQLMIDQDLGKSLLAAIESWMHESGVEGHAPRATRLSLLRHRLARELAGVHRALAESEDEGGPSIEIDFIDPEPEPESPATVEVVPAQWIETATPRPSMRRPAAPRIARSRERAPRSARSRRSMSRRASWLLLCATFAATFFLLKPRSWIGAATPAEVGAAELAGDGLYLAVESRHPSLFVTVDAAAWETSSVDQRHERVELASSVLRRRGYAGAYFNLPDRRPVARWLATRGTELLEAN